jgi:hypothetical protein
MDDLRALANYAAALCRHHLLDGESRSLSADEKKNVDGIRQAVPHREFTQALDLLGEYVGFGNQHILFLRSAFPFLSDEEKAAYLSYAWQRMKGSRSQRLACELFQQAAPALTATIPESWPTAINVYRGRFVIDNNSMSHDSLWRWVKGKVRNGIAWTIDRNVALDFTKVERQVPEGQRIIGCLGSATVSRQDVIAYFGTPEGDIVCELDETKECIIDPQRISRVTYEEITAPNTKG